MEKKTAKNPHLLHSSDRIMIMPPMTAENTLGMRSGYLLKLYFFFNDPDRTHDVIRGYKYFEISETVG